MARFTIEFGDDINEMLEKLAKEQQVPKREILSRALALYVYLHDEGVRVGGDKKLSITPADSDQILKDIIF